MTTDHLAGELQMSEAIELYIAWKPESEGMDLQVNNVGELAPSWLVAFARVDESTVAPGAEYMLRLN
jgi:hypothetical protein